MRTCSRGQTNWRILYCFPTIADIREPVDGAERTACCLTVEPTLPSSALDADLVERLVNAQFPHWAQLPIEPVDRGGWDNCSFRLGREMVVRLPSASVYAPQVLKEHFCRSQSSCLKSTLTELAGATDTRCIISIVLGRNFSSS